MSDDTKLKIGEHEINDHHIHAYDAIKNMSEDARNQLFKNAHESEHGGLFTAHVNGKDVEYKLSHSGEIHEHR